MKQKYLSQAEKGAWVLEDPNEFDTRHDLCEYKGGKCGMPFAIAGAIAAVGTAVGNRGVRRENIRCWTCKIIPGAEAMVPTAIFSISTNGVVTTNFLDIQSEDFDLIPTTQDLYCVHQRGAVGPPGSGNILRLPNNLLTYFVGRSAGDAGGRD